MVLSLSNHMDSKNKMKKYNIQGLLAKHTSKNIHVMM